MHDADGMRGMHRVGDLADDRRNLVDGERPLALRVLLEDLAGRPLDGEEVHSRAGLTDLDGAHDVGMLHALAVPRFAKEARDRRAVLAKLLAQHFDGNCAVIRVLGTEDG